ncbi:hypothetical protein ACIQF6_01585 [Kitasatospora sp. NPDC092948]|uniref:hypothetical protein n=1 Tax=Kitasatospora sp. NPDC092948 TaxID=3364088 RepID=UPI0037FC5552
MSRNAKAIAALVVGIVAVTVGAPMLADMSAGVAAHRKAPPGVTIDFTGPGDAVGAGFAGTGAAKDTSGTQVGTAHNLCNADAIQNRSAGTLCTADLAFDSGDRVAFTVVIPTDDPTTTAYPRTFDGVVTGGTGAYRGLTGAVHFANTATAVYQLTWDT